MRKLRLGCLIVGSLIGCTGWATPGAAQAPGAASSGVTDYYPFVPRQVSPEVRLFSTPPNYSGPAIGNIVIIEQSDGLVVVDSGGSIGHGRKAVRYIKTVTDKPVKAIVITHWHNDHPQGVAAFRDAWPKLRLIATPQTKAGMLGPELDGVGLKPDDSNDKKMLDLITASKVQYQALLNAPDTPADRKERIRRALGYFDAFYADFHGTYVIPPSETFNSRLLLADPQVPVELLYFGRANTEGDALAWLPKQKIVATGDIVVSPIPFGFGSYPADWITTIGKIKRLGFRTLIPGHGEPMTNSDYLDTLVASIAKIRTAVGGAVKAGLTFSDIKEKVDLLSESDRFGTIPRLKPSVPGLWTEPMTINAYKEAKGIPITQTGDATAEPK